MKHELKILDKYFDSVESGIKPFEVRNNDRDFHVGDMLRLREVEEKENEQADRELTYTGRYCEKYITYILPLSNCCGVENSYVVLGLKDKTYRL